MTLVDLKTRCEEQNITYQYGIIEDNTEPPYLCGVVSETNNFVADNKVFHKIQSVELYYTYKVKDITLEETIENEILVDVVWRKGDEQYLADNNVWQVIYYFNI